MIGRFCSADLKEAIASLIFAAPRCADLPELAQVRTQFQAKYGKEFIAAAAELRAECGVNRRVSPDSLKSKVGESNMMRIKSYLKYVCPGILSIGLNGFVNVGIHLQSTLFILQCSCEEVGYRPECQLYRVCMYEAWNMVDTTGNREAFSKTTFRANQVEADEGCSSRIQY